jgi:regulator of replication initiation timing
MKERTLSQKVVQLIESKGKVDIGDIATHLQVNEADVRGIIDDLKDKIRNTILPYSQVELSDLSQELGFSYDFLLIFLRMLIKNGVIQARLDMVNKSLVIPMQMPSAESQEIDLQKLKKKRDLLVTERDRKILEQQKVNELKQGANINTALQGLFGDITTASNVSITATSLKNRASTLNSEIRRLNIEIEEIEREMAEASVESEAKDKKARASKTQFRPSDSLEEIYEIKEKTYSPFYYIGGHPRFQEVNIVKMILKPNSIILGPTMGSKYEMHLEIPLRPNIIIEIADGNNFKLIYEDSFGGRREVILEPARWHSASEIIARIKYYAKNAQAS